MSNSLPDRQYIDKTSALPFFIFPNNGGTAAFSGHQAGYIYGTSFA